MHASSAFSTASPLLPMIRLSVVLAALVVLGGCAKGPLVRDAPDRGTSRGFPDHTASQIVAAVAASVANVRAASSDGRITLTSGGRSQDATFSLRARFAGTATDSVTVVVRGPLGIEGGRGVVSADSFLAADRINRRLYVGTVDAVERYVPGGGSPEQLARAALGLLVPEADTDWIVTPAANRYVLRAPLAGGGTRELVVDPALWRVVALRDRDRSGALVGSQEASAFDRVQGVVVPRRVLVTGGDVEAVLEHRTLALNPADLRLRFSRPDGYEVVRLR